jgi:hypothetical protein
VLAQAQEEGPEPDAARVEIVSGRLPGRRVDFYRLLSLQEGDRLYAYVRRESGNLDPFVAVSATYYRGETLAEAFWGEVDLAVEQGEDPLEALPAIYDDLFAAWDDDSGQGYDAALQFEAPADGDYQLLVTDSPVDPTFGDYTLLLGINEPQVLTGEATAVGRRIAILDRDVSQSGVSVEELTGTLTLESPQRELPLRDMEAGDVLYVYVEATSGDLVPILVLEDFGTKPLRSANLGGSERYATLTYRFRDAADNHKLVVVSTVDADSLTTGEYRLLVGVNAPGVVTGEAEPVGPPAVRGPLAVAVGVRLQQIAGVDQVAEKFGAVVELDLTWQDPLLAFSPDTCGCTFKVFNGDSFSAFAQSGDIEWPQFTVFNQQGNRWTQNRNVVVQSDGSARYFERFTTDFQVPDFNFVKFPFDTQTLYIRIHSLFPEEYFVFYDPPDMSSIGEKLGEEEWYIIDSGTETTIEDGHSQFALRFEVARHLNYYIFRIFLPIGLIILVSWFSFFLRDYGKRVDVAGANLLVFVAFNFTVAGQLPRLGYLTFMDAVLIGVFAISAFVVIFNVFLRRLDLAGKREKAERIDRFSLWIYPLAYIAGAVAAYFVFLAA